MSESTQLGSHPVNFWKYDFFKLTSAICSELQFKLKFKNKTKQNKKCLLPGSKAKIKLDSILKSRDISLLTSVHVVKALFFPVVIYGCESWTVKKTECRRIDAFELWCWRRLLRVPWTARRTNQTILKEISPECSLEGLMLKLKLQYFGHVLWGTDSLFSGKDWR